MTVQKCPCGKDAYSSAHEARVKCRNMGNRFRVYTCRESGAWHVTKQVGADGQDTSRQKAIMRRKFRHGE